MESRLKTGARVLYYTISTPDVTALACTRLLNKSLINKLGPIDFKIVVPQGSESEYPEDVKHLLLPSVKPNPTFPLIFDLKYTPTVYALDYDNFVYLDSDILWFSDDFDPSKNQYCEELGIRQLFYTTGWNFIPNQGRGANAGFFSVDKKTGLDMIYRVNEDISQREKVRMPDRPWLEQSMFNLYLYTVNYKGWQTVTDKVVNSTRPDNIFEDGKIYHFQGWTGGMDSKIKRMEGFIANNSSAEAIKALKL